MVAPAGPLWTRERIVLTRLVERGGRKCHAPICEWPPDEAQRAAIRRGDDLAVIGEYRHRNGRRFEVTVYLTGELVREATTGAYILLMCDEEADHFARKHADS